MSRTEVLGWVLLVIGLVVAAILWGVGLGQLLLEAKA